MLKIKIFEDDYTDWYGGRKIRHIIFEPDIFALISKNFGEIKYLEVFDRDTLITRIYRISYGRSLGKLTNRQLIKLAGLFDTEVQVIEYQSKHYSPQSSRLFGLRDFCDEYVDTIKIDNVVRYEIEDTVLKVYL